MTILDNLTWAAIHGTLNRGQAERDLQRQICPGCDSRVICPGTDDPNCEIHQYLDGLTATFPG